MTTAQIRTCLLYEYKLNKNATEAAFNICQAWGKDAMTKRNAQRWFTRFRSGVTSIEDECRSGRPSAIDNNILKSLIESNPRQSTRELAEILNVDNTTVCDHLAQIGKVKKLQKWVPHLLSEKLKIQRLSICSSLLLRNKNESLLPRIVTCDEKWIMFDNSRRSGEWVDNDARPSTIPKRGLTSKKVMITVWWSMKGIIHYDFLKPGESITAESYCKLLDAFHEKLRQKHPALVNRDSPLLLHDNARPHVAKLTIAKLHELGYEILPHPPYSPDISPTDYHLFLSFDNFLRHKMFNNQYDVQQAFVSFIESRDPDFFKSGINKLVERWQSVVDANGAYFDE